MKSKKISEILKTIRKLSLIGVKDATTHIVNYLLHIGIIYVCDDTFYLRSKNLLIPISDREAHAAIRSLIADDNKAQVSSYAIKEASERLRDMSEVHIDIDEIISKNKYKVLLENGVFDVESGKFDKSPPKNDLYPYEVKFKYIPDSTLDKAPVFAEFVKTSLGEENLNCLLEWFGYMCTTLTDARKAMFFIGAEQCGKSVLLDVIENALGSENVSSVSFSKLGTEQSKIKYQGKIANLSREASAEPLKSDDDFKSIISGEKNMGRRLYENSKEFVIYAKFTTAANFFPHFKHMDTATLDRIILIYFMDRAENKVPTDFHLKDKLIAEKDIIFSMALDRMAGLIKSGYQFSMSKRAKEVLHSKRMELLNVTEFLKERYDLDPESVISSAALFQSYKDWCYINAIAPEGRNTFYSKVTDYSSTVSRGKFIIANHNLNGFKGLKIKCEYGEDLYGQSYQDSPSSTQEGGEAK